jgi:predicted PurR-regulated permease PerM
LFRKTKFKTEKDENGVNVASLEYEDIEFPKHENETYCQYLFRLTVEKENKLMESFENSFGNISNFSKQIQSGIFGAFSLGEQLSKTIKAAQSINISKVKPISVSVQPSLDLDKLTNQISENRLKPFNDLSDKLDKLIDLNADSIQFMIEANNLQTKIAEEIKGSSDTSTRLSLRNIYIALIVLFVSTLSFVFSIYSVRESNKSSEKYIDKVITGLDKIDKSIKDENLSNQKRLNDLENRLDTVIKHNLILQQELDKLKKAKKNNKITPPNNGS